MSKITEAIQERILVLDGAMGTMLQRYNFSEEDFRGERFKDFPHSLKGNNDLLSITQPEAVKEVHRQYFQAGADIVETNTFSGTTIGMADYHLEDLVYELNYESAKIAREVADEVIFMDQGVIMERGTPDQIFSNPQQERTRQFLNMIH